VIRLTEQGRFFANATRVGANWGVGNWFHGSRVGSTILQQPHRLIVNLSSFSLRSIPGSIIVMSGWCGCDCIKYLIYFICR
jgi:hypothetical protein